MSDEMEASTQMDDDLLARLRAAVTQSDQVPAEVVAAARASFMWHTIDAELAELTYDSLVDAGDGVLVRSSGGARLLTFESTGLTVELEATTTGSRRRIVGQLIPAQPATVEIRHAGGVATDDADEVGGFVADDVMPGPVSVRCRSAAGTAEPVLVDTDWFLV